jgi:ribonucleoside-triphosphate reductase
MKIKTQNGHTEKYNKKIIVDALMKDDLFLTEELKQENGITRDIAQNIAGRVTRIIKKLQLKEDAIISSDTIRGLVATELIEKQYMNLLNVTEVVGLRIQDIYKITRGSDDTDNANLTPNPETSHKLIADTIMKKYYLRMLPKKLANMHINGDGHFHDLEYFGTRPFCRSWDLRKFFLDGFAPDGENNGICAAAPKHAEVAILQATKVLAMGQCNHAGGQGLLYGTVFLAPYMRNKTYKEIKQLMQMMLYELNQMYISRGGQVIFSSINISPGCPKVLEDVPIVCNGKIEKGTYKDCEREIRLQFKALMELSIEGDSSGKLFPFPKLECSIENKFINW